MSRTLYIEVSNPKVKDYYQNWKTNHEGDSGVDLPFPNQRWILPTETQLIDLGIKVMLTDDKDKPTTCLLVPRSSIYKTPLLQVNSIGIIDGGYRGPIMVPIYNRPTLNIIVMFYLCMVALKFYNYILYLSIIMGAISYFIQINKIFSEYLQTILIMFRLLYKIEANKALFQICSPDMCPLNVEIVDKLPDSTRGSKGFGSTG